MAGDPNSSTRMSVANTENPSPTYSAEPNGRRTSPLPSHRVVRTGPKQEPGGRMSPSTLRQRNSLPGTPPASAAQPVPPPQYLQDERERGLDFAAVAEEARGYRHNGIADHDHQVAMSVYYRSRRFDSSQHVQQSCHRITRTSASIFQTSAHAGSASKQQRTKHEKESRSAYCTPAVMREAPMRKTAVPLTTGGNTFFMTFGGAKDRKISSRDATQVVPSTAPQASRHV